ncbi:MAG: DUF6089 family protein [Bacteroidota bacterium]
MKFLNSIGGQTIWLSVLFCLLISLPAGEVMGQRAIKLALGSGTTYYQGDITDGFDNSLYRPTISFSVANYVGPYVSFRGEITQGWIGAADSLVTDPIRNQRNLSFRSPITDFSFQLVVDFLEDRSINKAYGRSTHFTPYGFVGFGGFFMNPQGLFQGVWYDLHSLGTEGQYLVGSTIEPYSKFQLNVPFGLGIEYRATKHWGFQVEASYRYTFTDYIDDVSTVYPSQELLRDQNPIAAFFANPSSNPDLFIDGSPRGNPRLLDAYFFANVKLVYFFEEVSRYSRCFR